MRLGMEVCLPKRCRAIATEWFDAGTENDGSAIGDRAEGKNPQDHG